MENETGAYSCDLETFRFNFFTTFISTPSSPSVYISLAMLHLLFIVLPSIFFNSLAIVLLYKTNKDKQPSVVVFYWICTVCIAGPCSYGLLMDLSLLFDQSVIGDCLIQWQGAIYWYSHSFFNSFLYWLLGILSIVLYLAICGIKLPIQKMNIILCCVLTFFIFETLAFIIGIETQSKIFCHVRGSFCLAFYTDSGVVVFVGFVRVLIGFAIPATTVVIMVILSFIKVKKSSLAIDKLLLRSLARLITVMITAAFLITSPTLFLYFGSYHGFHQGFMELISTYTIQINYVLYPILILTMHKQARKMLKKELYALFKKKKHYQKTTSSLNSEISKSMQQKQCLQEQLSPNNSQATKQDLESRCSQVDENSQTDNNKSATKTMSETILPTELLLKEPQHKPNEENLGIRI